MAEFETGFAALAVIEKRVREDLARAEKERGSMQPPPIQPTKRALREGAERAIITGMREVGTGRGMDAEAFFRSTNQLIEGREPEAILRRAYSKHPFGRPNEISPFD